MGLSFGFDPTDKLGGWTGHINDGFIVFYSTPGEMINQLGVDCV